MPSKIKRRCSLEGIGIGFALGEAVAATVPLGRMAFPAKPVERSGWSGGLRSAVAIAHHHPLAPVIDANDAKATAFSGRDERVAPLRSLSSMTRGASRDSRRYRRTRPAIRKTFPASLIPGELSGI